MRFCLFLRACRWRCRRALPLPRNARRQRRPFLPGGVPARAFFRLQRELRLFPRGFALRARVRRAHCAVLLQPDLSRRKGPLVSSGRAWRSPCPVTLRVPFPIRLGMFGFLRGSRRRGQSASAHPVLRAMLVPCFRISGVRGPRRRRSRPTRPAREARLHAFWLRRLPTALARAALMRAVRHLGLSATFARRPVRERGPSVPFRGLAVLRRAFFRAPAHFHRGWPRAVCGPLRCGALPRQGRLRPGA